MHTPLLHYNLTTSCQHLLTITRKIFNETKHSEIGCHGKGTAPFLRLTQLITVGHNVTEFFRKQENEFKYRVQVLSN